jgi:hypothetical protein
MQKDSGRGSIENKPNKSKEVGSEKIQKQQNHANGRKSHNLELEEFRQEDKVDGRTSE